MLESDDKTHLKAAFVADMMVRFALRGTDLGCKMLGNALMSPDLAKVLTLGSENTVTAQQYLCSEGPGRLRKS